MISWRLGVALLAYVVTVACALEKRTLLVNLKAEELENATKVPVLAKALRKFAKEQASLKAKFNVSMMEAKPPKSPKVAKAMIDNPVHPVNLQVEELKNVAKGQNKMIYVQALAKTKTNMEMIEVHPTEGKLPQPSNVANVQVETQKSTKVPPVQMEAIAPKGANNARKTYTIKVLSVGHGKGATGEYFSFDRPSAWSPAQAMNVTQCRAGKQIWAGRIIWWEGLNESPFGNSFGRRHSRASPGQWEVNDTATYGKCQAEGISTTSSYHAATINLSDPMASELDATQRRGSNTPSYDVPQHQEWDNTAVETEEQSSMVKPVASKSNGEGAAKLTHDSNHKHSSLLLPVAVLLLVLLVILGLFREDREDSFTKRLAQRGKI